ncbi:MAG: efflux RND transporter periplasmic adaptor subunit [Phycisphaerales bacterium]
MSPAPAHPDVIPAPPRRSLLRIGLPLSLLLAVMALLAFASRDSLRPRIAVEAVPVALRAVEIQGEPSGGDSVVVAPGWIEADPSTHRLAALADGVVEQVLVLEGERISVGQPIATLVADEARIALERADAERSRREAMRAEAEARLKAARLGREALIAPRRRVAIAESDAIRLAAQAAAAVATADAAASRQRELADELERLEALAERGGASEGAVARLRLRLETSEAEAEARRREADAARAAATSAGAERDAARSDLELLIDENLAVESAEASLAAAEAEWRLASAARDDAQLRLDRMTVRSPIDGVVIERLAVPGMRLGGENTVIAEAYDPRHLQVRVDVPLAEVGRIGVGQSAEISLDLLPDRIFQGVVTRLVHRADLAKNTVPVKVRIIDPDPRLKPDMLARVRFLPSAAAEGALRSVTRVFAPDAAIREEPDGAFATAVVSIADRHGIAEARRLELGPHRVDGWREVIDGLRAGEWIVLGEPPADGAAVELLAASPPRPSKESSR